MTAEIERLVLDHLCAIRGKQDQHDERLDRIEIRLSAIEQTLGTSTPYPAATARPSIGIETVFDALGAAADTATT
jgi:hypothetical protein